MLIILAAMNVQAASAAPQIGGGTCSTSMVTGTYFYLLSGSVASGGGAAPYAELGKLVADGMGGVSGQSFASVNGQQTTYTLTGTYTVQPNCAGSISLSNSQTTNTLAFQIVNSGEGMVVAIATSGAVVVGTASRQSAGTSAIQCGTGSLSGGYGYLLTGVAGNSVYTNAGQFVADGNGNGSVASVTNVGGNVAQVTATGTYSVASDCSGTARVSNQNGTVNYRFAIVRDGQSALFFETDAGATVSGAFTTQFAPPNQAIVNGASFQPSIAPGSLFSIFGTGLAAQTASASTLPLSRNLGGAQVFVNGEPAPLVYVSGNQINAQMPVDVPTGRPISVTITNAGGATSNAVSVTVPAAAPGIFTYNGNEAIVQNQDGSLNSTGAPAHPGDVLVAYLTGGGAVNAAGPWVTGAGSPGGPSSVSAPYSLTVGGKSAVVEYLGLTPGFVGLYQANFIVPAIAPGSYPVVVTVGGLASNAPSIAVGG